MYFGLDACRYCCCYLCSRFIYLLFFLFFFNSFSFVWNFMQAKGTFSSHSYSCAIFLFMTDTIFHILNYASSILLLLAIAHKNETKQNTQINKMMKKKGKRKRRWRKCKKRKIKKYKRIEKNTRFLAEKKNSDNINGVDAMKEKEKKRQSGKFHNKMFKCKRNSIQTLARELCYRS